MALWNDSFVDCLVQFMNVSVLLFCPPLNADLYDVTELLLTLSLVLNI